MQINLFLQTVYETSFKYIRLSQMDPGNTITLRKMCGDEKRQRTTTRLKFHQKGTQWTQHRPLGRVRKKVLFMLQNCVQEFYLEK